MIFEEFSFKNNLEKLVWNPFKTEHWNISYIGEHHVEHPEFVILRGLPF